MREIRESLDKLILLGQPHLYRVLKAIERHRNQGRPHQGLGDLIPVGFAYPAEPALPTEMHCIKPWVASYITTISSGRPEAPKLHGLNPHPAPGEPAPRGCRPGSLARRPRPSVELSAAWPLCVILRR
jgi:hypothetical protein